MDEEWVNGLSSEEAKSEVLSWDWERNAAQTVKLQIELFSNHIVKSEENKVERRNRQ